MKIKKFITFTLSVLFICNLFILNINSLSQQLPDVSDIAEKAAPSVVGIELSAKGEKSYRLLYRDGNDLKIQPKVLSFESKLGDGSGFIISKEGYIVTNAHVVKPVQEKKDAKIEVILSNNNRYEAEVIGVDEDSDVAVIKINSANLDLKPIGWADSSKTRPGEFALTIGSSLGAEQTVGFGIISAVSRKQPKGSKEALFGDLDYIQTYAQINPGNSGGPLINLNGEVIGITSFIQIAPHSPGFAIPSNYAQNIVPELIKNGYIKRPSLGVYVYSINQSNNLLSNLLGTTQQQLGISVREVKENGPADKSGLKPGDIILKINEKDLKDPVDFIKQIRHSPIGTSFNLEILRENVMKNISVKSELL